MTSKRRATPAAKRTLSTADIVHAAKLPSAPFPICTRGDLVTAYQEAAQRFDEAKTLAGESLAGTPADLVPLARAVEEIRQEMQDYTLNLVLRALPRTDWKRIEAEHPPRRNDDGSVHDEDRRFGVDITTFFPAALPASVAEPQDMTPELWDLLLSEKLTDGQIEDLCVTVWNLNQSRVSVPFSPAVSKILADFGKK